MASLSVRDAIVVLLLLWIPASLYLLFNHTTSVRTELRKDLLRQMREDHELMAPHEFTPGGVHSPGLRAGAATAVLPKAPAPRKPAGWPTDPLYDPTNRAVTVEDLDLVEFNEASWLEIAQALHEKNRWMLETVPEARNLTLVSGLWDLGRDKIKTSKQWESFKRPFSYYTDKLEAFLAYKFPKVLYCEAEHAEEIKAKIASSKGGPTRLIFLSKAQIKRNFHDFDLLQGIRKRKDWYSQADWLASAPQASMEYYNPVVMSKLFFTRDVARWNPYSTDRFLWMDAAHLCNNPRDINPDKLPFMLSFLDRLLITFFDYEPFAEIHGFEHRRFDEFLGVDASDKKPLKIGRGGVFGGPRAYLEAATAVYEIALSETLSHGVMGTEENLFSILDYRFPELVHHYDNNDGGNCAIFDEWARHIDFKVSGYDVRGLQCRFVTADNAVRCFYKNIKCPAFVTPEFLTLAEGQGICQNNAHYYCEVVCQPRSETVVWQGLPCGPGSCPPPRFFDEDFSVEKGKAIEAEEARRQDAAEEHFREDPIHVPSELPETPVPVLVEPEMPAEAPVPEREVEAEPAQPPAPVNVGGAPADAGSGQVLYGRNLVDAMEDGKYKNMMETYGFDLRGLHCQVMPDGKEQCYNQEDHHRELCPPFVTSVYLSLAKGQWSCESLRDEYFCTAACQEGVDKVAWAAHQYTNCAKNDDNCPKRPPVTPVDEYKVKPWDGTPWKGMDCTAPADGMPPVTIMMLVRNEVDSLRNTLRSYERSGFLQVIPEFLLWVNGMTPEIEEVVSEFKRYKIKVMGDTENYGITYPLNWMVGNATHEHVLFLEKDFQIVESGECAQEQIASGVDLIKAGTANVVKYRSRHLAGKPNWAQITYRGKEDTVLKRQPNLLCNFYHWIDNPDRRWPEKFWPCGKTGAEDGEGPPNDVFYCSSGEYCNWTNNPVLFSKEWWLTEYVHKRFGAAKSSNPYKNLEGYMNWEKGSWNKEGWVVAQGEGLFTHRDTKNFGGGW